MYCTQQDLLDRMGEPELIQRSNRDGTGTLNSTVINQAITDACAEIDGYLTQQTTPLSTVTPRLTSVACDISIYYLYRGAMIEEVEKRYLKAVDFVQLVNIGKAGFSVDTAGAPAVVEQAILVADSPPRLFGRMR